MSKSRSPRTKKNVKKDEQSTSNQPLENQPKENKEDFFASREDLKQYIHDIH